jgi:hypothetical protein
VPGEADPVRPPRSLVHVALVIVLVALCACDDPHTSCPIVRGAIASCSVGSLDAGHDAAIVTECNCFVLGQAGCAPSNPRCTWVTDTTSPRQGFIACAPTGVALIGEACRYAITTSEPGCGVHTADDCVAGAVCSAMGSDGIGVCKQICDTSGGNPMCDASHACVEDPELFHYGSQAVAGVCDPM